MRRTQIHWLIVGIIPILILNYLFWIVNIVPFASINAVVYVGMHSSYLFIVLLPCVFSRAIADVDFVDAVSAICAAHFLLQFVLCIFTMVIPWKSMILTIALQGILLLLFAMLLIVNTYYASKEKVGFATKHEIQILKQCRQELDLAQMRSDSSINARINIVQSLLKHAMNRDVPVIHGFEEAILSQCQELHNCVIIEQGDGISLHLAILEQLLEVWQGV